MADTIRLNIEVEDKVIIVTLPGTTFRVNYNKAKKSDGLVAFGIRGDKDAGVSQVDFLTRAWRIANDKVRELGWIM
jgi:hypothetical protein